jgi:hypothetical protein
MELKIFKKKHVSFQEMLVFLIKFIFYFDTTELYIKTNKKIYQKNGKDTLSLFDYCFYGDSNLDKIINIINCQSGGSEKSLLAGVATGGAGAEEGAEAGKPAQGKEAGEAGKPAQGKEAGGTGGEAGKPAQGKEAEEEEEAAAEKPAAEPEAKAEAEVADIGVMDFINELKDGIVKGINLIKTKLLAILTLILYASIFPAIPFFLVMTSMYATLKYIMFKFRNF